MVQENHNVLDTDELNHRSHWNARSFNFSNKLTKVDCKSCLIRLVAVFLKIRFFFVSLQDEGIRGGEREERPTHTRPGQKEQSLGGKGQMYGYVELPEDIPTNNYHHPFVLYFSTRILRLFTFHRLYV